ncbi:MAG: hypothetical protein E7C49_14185 [Clostridium sp.]|nr:hypothetical protein [Clostridium sp.]
MFPIAREKYMTTLYRKICLQYRKLYGNDKNKKETTKPVIA